MDLGTIQFNLEANTTDLPKAVDAMEDMADAAQKAGDGVDVMGKKVAAGSKAASDGVSGFGRSAGQAGIQIQQLVGQIQGGQSAFLALSAQATDLGIVLGAPLVGVVVGLGAALAGSLAPSFFKAEDSAEKLIETMERIDGVATITKSGVLALSDSIQDLANKSEIAARAQIVVAMADAEKAAKQAAQSIATAFDQIDAGIGVSGISDFTEPFEKFNQLSDNYISTANELGQSFGLIGAGATDAGFKVMNLLRELRESPSTENFDKFQDSVSELAVAGGTANKEFLSVVGELQKYFSSAATAAEKTEYLKKAMDDLNGAVDQSGESTSKSTDESIRFIETLERQIAVMSLTGDALAKELALQSGATGLKRTYIEQLINEKIALEQKAEAAKKAKQESDEANRIEKQRAQSIQKMTDQLAKEAALMGNASKEAEIRYGISSGLINAYGAEADALIRNAQAVDAQREAMKRANVESGLMADFESALGKENAQIAELDKFSQSVDNFGGAWSRTGSIVVDALGSIVDAMDDYQLHMVALGEKEEEYAKLKVKYQDDPAALAALAKERIKLDAQVVKANISGARSMAGAAASMFKESSKGRKALHAVEKTLAAVELSMAIKNTATELSLSATRTAAATTETGVNVAAGGAKMFAQSGWAGFAGVAAMVAAMASLGYSGGGGGGGGMSPEDIQAGQGTGTVLGSDEKSGSISAAFDSFTDIAIDQLVELRGIRDAMNGLSSGIALLARDFVAGGSFQGAGVTGMGTRNAGGAVRNVFGDIEKSLFGGDSATKKLFGSIKKEVKDSGLMFEDQELGEILAGNLEVYFYDTIETTKKKLFGLSKKKSTSDQLTGVDAAFEDQISGIFGFIGSAVSGSLSALGLESAIALERFKVNLGKVSLKDLSGEESQKELEAIFSQQADLIAGFVAPAMAEYQKMGEGLFETLTRVAQEQSIFNDAMKNMGLSMAGVSGIMAIDMAQSIAGMMGGFDKFTDKASQYVDKFFTDSEKFDMLQGALAETFGALNVTMPDTLTGFRSIVEGLDRTTIEGQKLFAALLEISPAFAEYADQVKDQKDKEIELAAKAAAELEKIALESARKAEDIAKSRYSLEIDLLKAQGNTEAAVAMERARILAGLDESLRPLQSEIWATIDAIKAQEAAQKSLTEAQEAAAKAAEQAAQQLADNARSAFDALSASISTERSRIEGIVSNASNAKSALESAIDAEKTEIQKQYTNRIEGLKDLAAQEAEIAKGAAQSRIDGLKSEQKAVSERVSAMQSLFDSLSSASDDIALQSLELTRARRASAVADIDAAIRRMQSGQGFPVSNELEQALQNIRDNPSDLYKSAADMAFETAKLQNKVATLASGAEKQLSTDEKLLASIEMQIASAENLAQVTGTKYDAMILQAEAELAAELASKDLLAKTAQEQFDKLTGIDTKALSVEHALIKYNEALLAADFENAQGQYERLDSLLSTGQSQLNAMLSIDDRILTMNDGVAKFIESINASQSDQTNKDMLAQMQRMADEITQLREEQRSQAFAQQKALNTTAKNTTELVYA